MRVRVVATSPLSPIVLLLMFLGCGTGVVIELAYRFATDHVGGSLLSLSIAKTATDLIICLIVTFFVLRSYHNLFSTSASIAGWWCAYALGGAFVRYLWPTIVFPVFGTSIAIDVLVRGFLVGALLWCFLGMALTSLMYLVMHLILFKYVPQTGTLCSKCGYDMAGLSHCPECGSPVVTGRRFDRTHNAAAWLHARRYWGPVVALLALTAVVGKLQYSARQASEMLGKSGEVWNELVGVAPVGKASGGLAVAGYGSLDDSSHGVLVVIPIDAARSGVAGQVQLVVKDAAGRTRYTEPMVVCNLSSAQTQTVRQAGVPESLRAEFLRRSKTTSVQQVRNVLWQGDAIGGFCVINPTPSIEIDAGDFWRE